MNCAFDPLIDLVCLLCTRIPHQNSILGYSTVLSGISLQVVSLVLTLAACGSATPRFNFPSVLLSGENQVSCVAGGIPKILSRQLRTCYFRAIQMGLDERLGSLDVT